MKVKSMPKDIRPRERLLKNGVSSLSDEELLAILIKTGTKSKSAINLALEVLVLYEKLENFRDVTISRLMTIKGIGRVKAIEIAAAIEFGRRVYKEKAVCKKRLCNSMDIYLDSKHLFYGKKQECFYCLYFNNKQELIERKLLFMGTINRSVVHPREVFKEAYLTSASSIVCMHNHPSGDTKPSREDIIFTKSLIKIGEINGIPVVDHIIVGDNSYYSFYESNNLFNL